MLNDFFKLNSPYKTIETQEEFKELILTNSCIRNILLKDLKFGDLEKKFKIKDTTFTNVSFSFKEIEKIIFINCKFVDCLFINTHINNCEFHSTYFENCNTYKIKITNTYIDPKNLKKAILKVEHANIGVHLFQQLLNNAKDLEQNEFAREANYGFLDWKRILSYNKFKNGKPYPIKFKEFAYDYYTNLFYKFAFGYGLRIRNFILSFSLIFIIFYFINFYFWIDYGLEEKDLSIKNFDPNVFSYKANFFYTIDVTTKIIDSQFQPTSNLGMFMFTFQGATGFVFFSLLITILINKFVKYDI